MINQIFHSFIQKMNALQFYAETISPYIKNDTKKILPNHQHAYNARMYINKLLSVENIDELSEDEKWQKLSKDVLRYYDISVDPERKSASYIIKKVGQEKYRNTIFDINDSQKELSKYIKRDRMWYTSCLTNLMIQFEDMISDIFAALVEKYPDKYLKDKSVSYADIVKAESIEQIKSKLFCKAIDNAMRQNVDSWIKTFKEHNDKFYVPEKIADEFNEIYYRRNIFVHNNGIVNEEYISSVKKCQSNLNDNLKIDLAYINKSISITTLYAIYIFCGLAKCFDDSSDFYNELSDFGFDLMVDKKWEMSLEIYLILKDIRCLDAASKSRAQFNFWLSQKEQNINSNLFVEVAAFDSSALNGTFVLCKLALLDKYDEFFVQLEKLYKLDIGASELKEWPIFSNIRKQVQYSDFIIKHSDEFIEEAFIPQEDSNNDVTISASLEGPK